MAENEDVNTLKRRGRRRLVGAIALVLAAVIVLPMMFDSEPKGSAPPVSVRIPGEDETGFAPKVTPKGPAVQEQKAAEKGQAKVAVAPPERAAEPVPEKAAEKAVAKAPEKAAEKAVEKAPERVAETPAPKTEIVITKGSDKQAAKAAAEPKRPEVAEKMRAEAALAGEQFMVPAGAYVEPAGVIEKLKAAKIPYYTEPIATKQGTVTRVRAGPFASRDAAEKALEKLKGLGLKPGNVAAKP
jgi:DedD protein